MDKYTETKIIASEFEYQTRQWATDNRSRPNIEFCKKSITEFRRNQFDLCVALEVIEHIDDYATFLTQIAQVALRAIVSTPNKFRSWCHYEVNTPEFDQHVREWSSGEFYWVLRCFWKSVEIHTIPKIGRQMTLLAQNESYEPTSKLTGVHNRGHVKVAACSEPVSGE